MKRTPGCVLKTVAILNIYGVRDRLDTHHLVPNETPEAIQIWDCVCRAKIAYSLFKGQSLAAAITLLTEGHTRATEPRIFMKAA